MPRHKKGFSFIELILVLSVIAIILAATVPSFKYFADQKNYTHAKTGLAILKNHFEQILDTNETLPKDPFATLKQIPLDPYYSYTYKGINTFGFYIAQNNIHYVIYSNGPNKQKDWVFDEKTNTVYTNNSDDIIVTNAKIVMEH